jgi:hypothetical protein
MVVNPAVIALVFAALLSAAATLGCSLFAIEVLRRWDLSSGSERQLRLERRTYLVSTVVRLVLLVEAVTLLLFVFNADRMSGLFVGAMCAVGALKANAYGFPALFLKIAGFFLAAVWLMMQAVDERGWDYPLIRAKYALLLVLAPLMTVSAVVQIRYFAGLKADVITSCCGALFSGTGPEVEAELASFEPVTALWAMAAALGAAVLAALHVAWCGRGTRLLALLGGVAFVVSLAGIISAVSIYVYEQPHHHCPFCLLKPEYGFIGYALYLPLFAATAVALGLGVVGRYRAAASLATVLPGFVRRWAIFAAALFFLTIALSAQSIIRSNLILVEWQQGPSR